MNQQPLSLRALAFACAILGAVGLLLVANQAEGGPGPQRVATATLVVRHWRDVPTPATTTTSSSTTTTTQPAAPSPTTARHTATRRASVASNGPHACGGDLPPCWVMNRESGGNPNAYNPTGCAHKDGTRGCYGKWQCDPSTCNGTGTEAQQDAEAARVWDHGHGCANWDAC